MWNLITRLKLILVVLIMMSASSAHAVLLTFDFTGEVISGLAPIEPGQAYSGQFTFESTTSGVRYKNKAVGYEYAITSFDIQIGDYYVRYLSGPSNIAVSNNDLSSSHNFLDQYSAVTGSAPNQPLGFEYETNLPSSIIELHTMGIGLIDISTTGKPTMLLNTDLPLSPPSLMDAEQKLASISGLMWEGPILQNFHIDLTVDTLTQSTAVPVPPAVWLFGSGLVGLIGVAKREAA